MIDDKVIISNMNSQVQKGWLGLAAGALVAQAIVLFVLDPGAIRAVLVMLTILVAVLIIRGSKLAWVLVFSGSAFQLTESLVVGDQYWNLVASGFILGCLISPPVIRFVWQRPRRGKIRYLTVRPFWEAGRDRVYRFFLQLAEWEEVQRNTSALQRVRSYRVLMWRLGGACLLLLVSVGATYSWEQELDGDSPIVNTLAAITWFGYVLVQLAFIAVAVMATYRHFSENR